MRFRQLRRPVLAVIVTQTLDNVKHVLHLNIVQTLTSLYVARLLTYAKLVPIVSNVQFPRNVLLPLGDVRNAWQIHIAYEKPICAAIN